MGTKLKGSQIKNNSVTGSQIADDTLTGEDIDESTLNIAASSLSGAFSFPDVDGSPNQVLKTDGNGNLTWQDESGSGSSERSFSGGSEDEFSSGSWTPGLEHGYTLQGTSVGRYQRIGDQVTVWYKFNVGTANNTATQEMKITGLPYQSASGIGIRSTGPQPHGVSFQCTTYIQGGESVIRFMDQTLTSAKQIANFASEGAIRGVITYWIGS